MVMIYNKRFFRAADYALFGGSLKVFKGFVADNVTEPTTSNFAAVCRTACAAPAIKPRFCTVMRREMRRIKRLILMAACTGFAKNDHISNPTYGVKALCVLDDPSRPS
jgi:hypothetical protein